jgi:hypothetical protein
MEKTMTTIDKTKLMIEIAVNDKAKTEEIW